MAEGGGVKRRDVKRFTDISKEPDKPLPPLQKFTTGSIPTLQDAVKSIQKLVDDLPTYVTLSLNKCKYPEEGLTQNESAALYLYSLQWPKDKHSFYTMFNRALRNEDRTKLIPYNSYLHLFMRALEKLPSIQDRVWRGINADISGQYQPQSVHVWWGASSCSDMVHVTDKFLDKDSHRTLFNIKCYEGKIIKKHSAFPNESEIVLPPGTCLRVKSVSNPAPKLHIIDTEQIPYEESPPVSGLSSIDSAADHHVFFIWLDSSANKSKYNAETQEQLRQLNPNCKVFEQTDQCESFIHQSLTSFRTILIVSGQIGRQIIEKIHDFSHLMTIFVYCMNKVENEKWAKNHKKIKAVVVSTKELLQQVKEEFVTQVQQEQLEKEIAAQAKQKGKVVNAPSTMSSSSDVEAEARPMVSLLEGYQRRPLVSLEEAVQPLLSLVPDVKKMVCIAKERCHMPKDGLSSDESASICIYTMEWPHGQESLYRILSGTLRTEDRLKLIPWFPYLKLILTALYKLPSFEGTVWRSVRADLRSQYRKGETYTWYAFSSATTDMEVLESVQHLDQYGQRTMFSIQCKSGKSISKHAYFQDDKEVLLMPCFQFEVLSNTNLGNGLCMINIKETEPLFPLLPSPFLF